MTRLYSLIVFTLMLITSMTAVSASSTSTERENEIQHLLAFIYDSGCTFIRNNDEHPATKAKSHIERKYNYVKSRVSSTEDFIKYAATKSSMSGKHYMVRCNGEKQASSQWLLDELAAYRQHQPGYNNAN